MKCIKMIVLGALLVASVLLTGCNTMRGAGEDVESAGEGVQDAVD